MLYGKAFRQNCPLKFKIYKKCGNKIEITAHFMIKKVFRSKKLKKTN